MKESRIYDMNDINMTGLRKELTTKVFGHTLIPEGLTSTKVVLTEVAPHGEFALHKDAYHHIFYFISGTGTGQIDTDQYDIHPGTIVEVPAGTFHAYKNTSNAPLILLTINIPSS